MTIPIPRRMRSRPHAYGLPVPWFVKNDTDPLPDFTRLSTANFISRSEASAVGYADRGSGARWPLCSARFRSSRAR